MSRLRSSLPLIACAVIGALGVSAFAQERTSPPRPPGGGGQVPQGSYLQTCRGANLNGNMLSAQCTGPTGAPVFSSIDTNGCRGRDIANDRGYLRCSGGGGGPRPPEPPRPVPPRPVPPRPIPPQPPRPIPPEPPVGGNFEAVVYTSANFRGQELRVRGPIANFGNFRGFNDNIRSIRIIRGAAEVCVDARYRGRCVTLRRSVSDLHSIHMGNTISSIR
ncbi:beta/gamma crystallin-related protein [soil metagenome]